ncbi:MAG: 50S ribosomal protein L30 [Desulfatibacillaceae bacterium]|nr:50S ribosomal protein L30 [Desulfatibacillaceae bacterium]
MSKKLKITLVRSMIGRPEKHRKVLRAMGLTRMQRTVVFEDNASVRGMADKVSHLVKVEEVLT